MIARFVVDLLHARSKNWIENEGCPEAAGAIRENKVARRVLRLTGDVTTSRQEVSPISRCKFLNGIINISGRLRDSSTKRSSRPATRPILSTNLVIPSFSLSFALSRSSLSFSSLSLSSFPLFLLFSFLSSFFIEWRAFPSTTLNLHPLNAQLSNYFKYKTLKIVIYNFFLMFNLYKEIIIKLRIEISQNCNFGFSFE